MGQFGREELTDPFGNIPKALSLISFIFYFDLHQTSMPCFLTSLKPVRGRDGCLIGPVPQTPSLANKDDYLPLALGPC